MSLSAAAPVSKGWSAPRWGQANPTLPVWLAGTVALRKLKALTVRRALPRRNLVMASLAGAKVKLRRSLSYVNASNAFPVAGNGSFPSEVLEAMDVAVLGEHHNQISDHAMEADFIQAFAKAKGPKTIALGLEMVEQPFQPVLDAFNRGDIDLSRMEQDTQWSKRWGWRFNNYAPVFEAARDNGMPLVALEMPTGLRKRVQLNGLQVLTKEEQARYMPDQFDFFAAARDTRFADYTEKALLRDYEYLLSAGALASNDRTLVTQENFLASLLLREEAIATAAWRKLQGITKKGSTPAVDSMVVLVGFSHVRFEYGVVRRLRSLGSGSQRFRVVGKELAINASPEEGAKEVGQLSPGSVFEANKVPSSPALRLPYDCGFVQSKGAVEALRRKPFKVQSIMLNPLPRESLAAGTTLNYSLPVQNLPESDWPKFSDYIWSETSEVV